VGGFWHKKLWAMVRGHNLHLLYVVVVVVVVVVAAAAAAAAAGFWQGPDWVGRMFSRKITQ